MPVDTANCMLNDQQAMLHVATGAELGKDWLLISPEDLQGKQLAATEGSYCLSRAVSSVKASHAPLSAHLTSLAIRMHELGARQMPIPLKARHSSHI